MSEVQVHDSRKTPFVGIVLGYLAAVFLLGALFAFTVEILRLVRFGFLRHSFITIFFFTTLLTWVVALFFSLIPFVAFRGILGLLPRRRAWHFALAGASVGVSTYCLLEWSLAGPSDPWSEPNSDYVLGELALAAACGVPCSLAAFAVENLFRRKSNTE